MSAGSHQFKSVARKCWTGVPHTGDYKDVYTLFEAGVKPGDAIMVYSNDANVVHMIRANFGPRVYGLVEIRDKRVGYYKYDWIYIPKPLKGAQGSSFEETMTAMAKRLIIPVHSCKIIFNASYQFLFCYEFLQMFGDYAFEEFNEKEVMKFLPGNVPPPIDYACIEGDPVHKVAEKLGQKKKKAAFVPFSNDTEVIGYHSLKDPLSARVEKFIDGNKRPYSPTVMSVWQLSAIVGPYYAKQCVTYIYTPDYLRKDGDKKNTISSLLGDMLMFTKRTFTCFINPTHIQDNKYKLKRITRNAVLEGESLDEYSSIYSSEILESFTRRFEHEAETETSSKKSKMKEKEKESKECDDEGDDGYESVTETIPE